MMRTEAQKRADARYREKKLYLKWSVTLRAAEAEELDEIIADAGISKAEFVRQAAKRLKKEGN